MFRFRAFRLRALVIVAKEKSGGRNDIRTTVRVSPPLTLMHQYVEAFVQGVRSLTRALRFGRQRCFSGL